MHRQDNYEKRVYATSYEVRNWLMHVTSANYLFECYYAGLKAKIGFLDNSPDIDIKLYFTGLLSC
jgi:hypothetical protein